MCVFECVCLCVFVCVCVCLQVFEHVTANKQRLSHLLTLGSCLSQLECGARWSPQSGCTQWFTGVTGTLQSYNFAGGQHLANQDYSICVRQEAGYCNIEYTADTFKISLGVREGFI